MGRAALDLATARPLELVLGQMLFDRYPHLVPTPSRMASLQSLLAELRDSDPGGVGRVRVTDARPLQVLEAWFDCWAAMAFREPRTRDCD